MASLPRWALTARSSPVEAVKRAIDRATAETRGSPQKENGGCGCPHPPSILSPVLERQAQAEPELPFVGVRPVELQERRRRNRGRERLEVVDAAEVRGVRHVERLDPRLQVEPLVDG